MTRNPSLHSSEMLRKKVAQVGFELIANPSQEVMEELKNTASIHFLFSAQVSGIKFKLLDFGSVKPLGVKVKNPKDVNKMANSQSDSPFATGQHSSSYTTC